MKLTIQSKFMSGRKDNLMKPWTSRQEKRHLILSIQRVPNDTESSNAIIVRYHGEIYDFLL